MHKFYNECAYFTAARYFRNIEKLANKIFEPTELPPAYAYILMYLEDYFEGSVTEIADTLGYERTTVSRMVKSLFEQELVEFVIVGRKKIVRLSPKGKNKLKIINECLDQMKLATDEQLGKTKQPMTELLSENYKRLRSNNG